MDIHDQITYKILSLEEENKRLLGEVVYLEGEVEYWREEARYWASRAADAEDMVDDLADDR